MFNGRTASNQNSIENKVYIAAAKVDWNNFLKLHHRNIFIKELYMQQIKLDYIGYIKTNINLFKNTNIMEVFPYTFW